MQITFEVQDSIAFALAVGSGWSPTVDDTNAELVGDNFPQIPNPVTVQEFVSGVVLSFLTEHVLNEGRNGVLRNFDSINDSINHQIKSGDFDELILSGNLDGIKQLVLQTLTS